MSSISRFSHITWMDWNKAIEFQIHVIVMDYACIFDLHHSRIKTWVFFIDQVNMLVTVKDHLELPALSHRYDSLSPCQAVSLNATQFIECERLSSDLITVAHSLCPSWAINVSGQSEVVWPVWTWIKPPLPLGLCFVLCVHHWPAWQLGYIYAQVYTVDLGWRVFYN